MSFHARLLAETARERAELQGLPIVQRALAGRIRREEYAAFLGQAYHHVRHTVPLLMACGARLPARHEWLRRAVAEYIEEEIGHEEWVLDDLEALGEDRRVRLQVGLLEVQFEAVPVVAGLEALAVVGLGAEEQDAHGQSSLESRLVEDRWVVAEAVSARASMALSSSSRAAAAAGSFCLSRVSLVWQAARNCGTPQ